MAQGVVDVLGSDHAPHTLAEKATPYPESPSGMTGVQTLVPMMLDHVTAGRLTLQRFVDLTSAGPARVFGIVGKGRIAAGYDADFTVVDIKRRETIRDRLDRLALRLDALRRARGHRLAGRDVRARATRDVGRGDRDAGARGGGEVRVNAAPLPAPLTGGRSALISVARRNARPRP